MLSSLELLAFVLVNSLLLQTDLVYGELKFKIFNLYEN